MKNIQFYTIAMLYMPIDLHPMFTLRYRKSRDNLSSSDVKLSLTHGRPGGLMQPP